MKIESILLILDPLYGSYFSKNASTIEMCILGNFLDSDVGCYWPSFKEWAVEEGDSYTSSNITYGSCPANFRKI
jgi:hypothetical protein